MTGIRVHDICSILEEWAPIKLAYPDDSVGLVLGSRDWDITRVMICLTITDDVVKEAIQKKVKLIISHHPLIYQPLRKIVHDTPYQKRINQLLINEIACYTCHTNLDVAEKGLNYILAQKLGLSNITGLLPVEHAKLCKLVTFVPKNHLKKVRDAVCICGAGIIGEYAYCSFNTSGTGTFLPSDKANPFIGEAGKINEEKEERFEVIVPMEILDNVVEALLESHPYEEVAYDIYPLHNKRHKISLGVKGTLDNNISLDDLSQLVKNKLNLPYIRVVGIPTQKIKNLAIIGGSGGGEIKNIPGNVDALITGDVKYHQALEAVDRGLAIIDAGHFGTEYPIVEGIVNYINQKFPLLETIIPEEKDPFSYK